MVPDAILIEFRLSENLTGLDAIEIISKELDTSIPSLIITGDTTDAGLKEITHSGYRYLHKPVDADQLLESVRHIVQSPSET